MSLLKKIILSYGISVLIAVVITISATVRMHNLNEFIFSLTNRTVPVILEEKRAERLFNQLRNIEKNTIYFPAPNLKGPITSESR